jgi:hypothetical protein
MEDAAIWDLTALIDRLPALTAKQYKKLVAASDGHSHTRVEVAHHAEAPKQHNDESPKEHHDNAEPPHVDKPGSKPHSHPKSAHKH